LNPLPEGVVGTVNGKKTLGNAKLMDKIIRKLQI
jgi:hypothetical protein